MVKTLPLMLLSAALAALTLPIASPSGVHVKVRVHHHKNAAIPPADARMDAAQRGRKVFHVTGTKPAFDELLTPAVKKKLRLDVWHISRVGRADGDELQADILATEDAMMALKEMGDATKTAHRKKGAKHAATHHSKLHVKQIDVGTEEDRVAEDRKEVASCLYATKGFETSLGDTAYTESAYFDCFHPDDQIIQFFDTLVEQNAQWVTKIENVSSTYEGRSIHAYKLSTSTLGDKTTTKKALYTQSLIHAREWMAGASTHFTFASLLDDLRTGKAETVKLFDEVDWYFVPIVNIDGYRYSWTVDRYWRVNRHPWNGYNGVDLNRNFPPLEYFNKDPTDVSDETNPGKAPLSEPESRGIYDFVMQIPELIGVVDVHAFAGMVLRPFSDVAGEPEEPYGSAMKRLGDGVRDAMSPKGEFQYISQPSGGLYPAYGCVDDAFYRVTNYTVPALTIEVEGDDFIARQNKIRKVGQDMNHGLRRFAQEASTYRQFIEKLGSTH